MFRAGYDLHGTPRILLTNAPKPLPTTTTPRENFMSKWIGSVVLAVVCLLLRGAAPAQALHIVLTNDDGFEAANLHALYQRLKQAGHSVIISAPALDATAQSGALNFGPIGPLQTASRGGQVPAGAPGVGRLASDPDVYYVDGTPVVSLLHGLDVVAQSKWGGPPDLVVSGVNYGNNTGYMTAFSGTVNAAIGALTRGLPAIAVSAGYARGAYRPFTELQATDTDYEIADFVVELVDTLECSARVSGSPLLPESTGLNVNVPIFEPGEGPSLPVQLARIGDVGFITPSFVMDLSLQREGMSSDAPALPGIAMQRAAAPDEDPTSEQNVVASGAIAISVLQTTHQSGPWANSEVYRQLGELLAQ